MKELFRNPVIRKYFISVVLNIPVEMIRSTRLLNTYLWRKYRYQKQGILDVLVELNKVLMGQNIDEWIRFFNVKTEGDLDMLRMQTNNAGILEAIKEVEHMSLSRWAKAQYEEHMKRVMDRKAEDAYVFDRGVERGIEQGIEQGIGRGRQ